MDVRYRDQYNVIILDRGTALVDCLLWSVYDTASTKHYLTNITSCSHNSGPGYLLSHFLQLQQQFH